MHMPRRQVQFKIFKEQLIYITIVTFQGKQKYKQYLLIEKKEHLAKFKMNS